MTLDHFAINTIRQAGEMGSPLLLKTAAGIAGDHVTPEQVKEAARFGMIACDRLVVDPSDPMDIADQVVAAVYSDGGIRVMNHHGGQFYEYCGGCHIPADPHAIRAGIYNILKYAQQVDGEKTNGELQFKPVKANTRLVNQVVDALRAVCHLHQRHIAPCWLEHSGDHPPANETLAMSNGLLHLPTRTLYSSSPLFWTHSATPYAWRHGSNEPDRWLNFLMEVFQDDPDSIDALQEWFGLLLLPDTRQQKILLIVGPKRSGKGTIGRVLTAMLGEDNVCAPTLAGLSSPFGLAPLIGKLAAIISDARLSSRSDQAIIAERLLSISGEDAITVDRKYSAAWTGRLSTRFIVMTNELPRLADTSGALASRFIVLNITQSFYGREDHGLLDKLIEELPGIFMWALVGYDRLRRRGHLVQPDSAREAITELEDLGSPVSAFIRDRCLIDPSRSVACSAVYEAWKEWCGEQGRDHPGTAQTIGRDLRAVIPSLRIIHRRADNRRIREYQGLGLK